GLGVGGRRRFVDRRARRWAWAWGGGARGVQWGFPLPRGARSRNGAAPGPRRMQISHKAACHFPAVPRVVLLPHSSYLLAKSGEEAVMQQIRRHAKLCALAVSAVAVGLAAGMAVGMTSAVGAIADSHTRQAPGITGGYAQVDPRNPARSQQVFLG